MSWEHSIRLFDRTYNKIKEPKIPVIFITISGQGGNTLNCITSRFWILETRNQFHIISGVWNCTIGDEGYTLLVTVVCLLNNRPLPRQSIRTSAGDFITGVFFLIKWIVWNVLKRGVGGANKFCFTWNIFPHWMTWQTTRMRLSANNKAEPEPNVANQHDEPNQQDEEDGLVVSGCAGLLNLDQGMIVHHTGVDVAAFVRLAARKWGS